MQAPQNYWRPMYNSECSPLLRSPTSSEVKRAPVHERLGRRNAGGPRPQTEPPANGAAPFRGLQRNLKRRRTPDMVSPDRSTGFVKRVQNRNWNAPNPHNSMQNRIDNIRNIDNNSFSETFEPSIDSFKTGNDLYADDAEDFTVEVINEQVKKNDNDDQGIKRFKLELDEKCQAKIKQIQAKQKDKTVVYPLPVTPTTTKKTLNERFSLL